MPDPSGLFRPVSGNGRLVNSALFVVEWPEDRPLSTEELTKLEIEVENAVLSGLVVVVSTALPRDVFARAGVVPLRYGAPRIIVDAGNWLGYRVSKSIARGEEPVRGWRLWRYAWDGKTDLLARPPLKRRSK